MANPKMLNGESGRPKIELDETRRKKLMKRLHLIKLNKSRGNPAFFEYSESKCKKLKINNIALAKSLADQKQEAATWYNQYVAMKASNQDAEEKLLRYQSMENGNFDRIVDAEVQNRIAMLAKLMESAVDATMGDARSMLDNLAECKRIVGCLSNIGKNIVLSNHLMNSRGSSGSRPPLCKNGAPKSPRKNVVHPMVGGYVMQPATICLPRVSLEDRYRYRLQERAERLEEQGSNNLSIVDEQSNSIVDRVASTTLDASSADETDQESSDEGNSTSLEVGQLPSPEAQLPVPDMQLSSLDNSPINESSSETTRNQSISEENISICTSSPCLENSLTGHLSSSLDSVENSEETPNPSLADLKNFTNCSRSSSCGNRLQNSLINSPLGTSRDNICEIQNSSPFSLDVSCCERIPLPSATKSSPESLPLKPKSARLSKINANSGNKMDPPSPCNEKILAPSTKNLLENLPLNTKSARTLKESKNDTNTIEDPLRIESISSPTKNLSETLPVKTKSARILKNSLKRKEALKETDDPLEGPSWLHVKQKKGGKNKRKKSNFTLVKPNVVRLVLESSSDCSDDDSELLPKNKQHSSVGRSSALCLSPSRKEKAFVIKDSPPKQPQQVDPEEMYMKVGRRSKKKSKLSNLESFIVNDPLDDNDKKHISPRKSKSLEKKLQSPETSSPSNKPLSFPLLHASINNTNNPFLVHEKECLKMADITYFLNSSMEMTQCISNDLKNLARQEEIEKKSLECLEIQSSPMEDLEIQNSATEDITSHNKPNKFFKGTENVEVGSKVNHIPVKTPFDVSLLEPSFFINQPYEPVKKGKENLTQPPSLNLPACSPSEIGKENVPPLSNSTSTDDDMRQLKNVSIVIEDILKSPVTEENEVYMSKSNSKSSKTKNLSSNKGKVVKSKKPHPQIITPKLKKVSRKKASSPNCNDVKEILGANVKTKLKRKIKLKNDTSELSNVNRPNSNRKMTTRKVLKNLSPDIKEKMKSKMNLKRKTKKNILVEKSFNLSLVKLDPDSIESLTKSLTISPSVDCSLTDDDAHPENSTKLPKIGNLKNMQVPCLKEATVLIKRSDDKGFTPAVSPNLNYSSSIPSSYSPIDEFEENIQYISSTFSSSTSSSSAGFEGFTNVENACLEKTTVLPKLLSKSNKLIPKVEKNVLSEIKNTSPTKTRPSVFTTDEIFVRPELIDLVEDNDIVDLECEVDPLSNHVEPEKKDEENEAHRIVNLHLLEEINKSSVAVIDEAVPRRRRAASKILSFKEPNLNKKMRQERVKETIVKKNSVTRKSSVQLKC